MPRWYENLKTSKPGAMSVDDGRLIGDVNHAAGNLVHRMYYWTGVLEEEPAGIDAAEAVEQLKDSLGELHRLVNRTMDLVRPIEARPLVVAANDVVTSVGLRLGCRPLDDAGAAVVEELAHYEVSVDPNQLDRAIGMLGEAFIQPKGPNDADPPISTLEPRIQYPIEDNEDAPTVLVLECTVASDPGRVDERVDSVAAAVSLALATRLLAVVDWRAMIDVDEEGKRRLTILVPITARATVTEARR